MWWQKQLWQPRELTKVASLPPPRCGSHKLKLVINSYEPYTAPRAKLFASLHRSGFWRFEDVIVVLGGSSVDAITWRPLSEDRHPNPPNVTVIQMVLNSFDLQGLSALHRYRRHPRVVSDTYVYLHDTCEVHERLFVPTFEGYRLPSSQLVYTREARQEQATPHTWT